MLTIRSGIYPPWSSRPLGTAPAERLPADGGGPLPTGRQRRTAVDPRLGRGGVGDTTRRSIPNPDEVRNK